MRTTSKVLGVVCAGWVALGLGALYAGATTSEPFPVKGTTTSERSHHSFTLEHESKPFEQHLLQRWFDGINKHKDHGCSKCDHDDEKWEHGDGCDSQCDHGSDTWDHGSDSCDPCGHGGKEPVKVIVIVKPFPEKEQGCESKCDHDDGDRNKGHEGNHGGDSCDPCDHHGTWDDGGDKWEPGDLGTGDDCEHSECEHSDRCPDDCRQDDCHDSSPHGLSLPVVGGLLG
jgi:hypothetical protein